jgi:AAA15 family ATPase/GTPase
MIKRLEIKNFKSIKQLELDCKRVNIFIGGPNSGKSNILEGIGILSLFSFGKAGKTRNFVRFENMGNLFYDSELGEKIEIIARDEENIFGGEIRFENGRFVGSGWIEKEGRKSQFKLFDLSYNGEGEVGTTEIFSSFKFYRFEVMKEFTVQQFDFLLPPSGENLLFLLQINRDLKKLISNIFSEFGLKIVLKPQEYKIEVQKEIEDIVFSYPYSTISDTLQRIIFYITAIETNKNSVIVLEEPEAHSFPYYTKFLAERIAGDRRNQYLISTHNPYFLLSVLEKTPEDEVEIFITYFQDYQTKVKSLSKEEKEKILHYEMDAFFNIDGLL